MVRRHRRWGNVRFFGTCLAFTFLPALVLLPVCFLADSALHRAYVVAALFGAAGGGGMVFEPYILLYAPMTGPASFIARSRRLGRRCVVAARTAIVGGWLLGTAFASLMLWLPSVDPNKPVHLLRTDTALIGSLSALAGALIAAALTRDLREAAEAQAGSDGTA